MLFDPRVIYRWAVPTASEWLWKIGTIQLTMYLAWCGTRKFISNTQFFPWVWGLWTKIIPFFGGLWTKIIPFFWGLWTKIIPISWVVYYWICHMKQGSLGVGTFSHQQGCSNLQFIARRLRKLVPLTCAYFCNLHPKPRWFRVLGAWATHQNAIGLWCCALIIFAGARAGFPGVREAPHGSNGVGDTEHGFLMKSGLKNIKFYVAHVKKSPRCAPPQLCLLVYNSHSL
jgi:hypothetical protein